MILSYEILDRCCKYLWTLCLFGLCLTTSALAKSRPNIILILTDDQGYADLGAYGLLKDIRTPHLDKLANDGALVTHGYSTAAQCIPSRAGIVSGKYQNRIELERNEQAPMNLKVATVAERMVEAGYRTGFVGKWHLEPNRNSKNWMKEHWPEGYASKKPIPPSIKMRDPYLPHKRGFQDVCDGTMYGYYRNFNLEGEVIDLEKEVDMETFRVDKQTQAATAFIKKNHKKPFFLHLAYFAPHVPIEKTEKYFKRFPGKMAERRRWGLASIAAIDDGVGAIVSQLKKYNLVKNTIIFFTSDNGAPLKVTMKDEPFNKPGGWDGSLNGPMRGEKGMLAEGGIRVPYLIHWKGKIKPQVYDRPITTLDSMATALALAGVKTSPGELDGVNLMPFLTGGSKSDPHDALYWRFWGQAAIREGDYKLLYLGDGTRMLFNLKEMDGEQKDISMDFPEKVQMLEKKLTAWCNGLPEKGLPTVYGREAGWYNQHFNLKTRPTQP
jgi:arylsulfatase A-like enzyme